MLQLLRCLAWKVYPILDASNILAHLATYLADCPLFNSGKGAVFNVEGKNELESSIMLSKPPASHPDIPSSRRGFGITLLNHVRNPSQFARALYLAPTAAPHTMLSGRPAEDIAQKLGIELVDESYFFTEARWREHRRGLGLPEEPLPAPGKEGPGEVLLDLLPTGTVGAVALDIRGCIAAVTSTGGRTNKLAGRIGDTPSMATGFWAEEWQAKGRVRRFWNQVTGKGNKTAVGVSGTGDGDVSLTTELVYVWLIDRILVLHSPRDSIDHRAPHALLERVHCESVETLCRRAAPRWRDRRCHRTGQQGEWYATNPHTFSPTDIT